MVYHGILWESMGIFSILLTVRVLFYNILRKAREIKGKKNVKKFDNFCKIV